MVRAPSPAALDLDFGYQKDSRPHDIQHLKVKDGGRGRRPTRALHTRVLAGVVNVFYVAHRNNNVVLIEHRLVWRIDLQV